MDPQDPTRRAAAAEQNVYGIIQICFESVTFDTRSTKGKAIIDECVLCYIIRSSSVIQDHLDCGFFESTLNLSSESLEKEATNQWKLFCFSFFSFLFLNEKKSINVFYIS